jgi:pimeloyl-ACP methyl ester carboxylesterase
MALFDYQSKGLLVAISGMLWMGAAGAQDFVRFDRAACASPTVPPPLHCPDSECSGPTVINQGAVVELETRRTYFLDYPCDLRRDEPVIFVLSLHGGGSYGNWQRHYFPLMDYVDQFRLVVATPNSPTQAWGEADVDYLENIVDYVYAELGEENVGAFWLVGHSQGGQTSNRLLEMDFFQDKLDGWVSLSGGRLGSLRSEVRAAIPRGTAPPPARPAPTAAARPDAGAPSGRGGTFSADAADLPDYAFSHIYSSGEHELTEAGLPPDSKWAQRLGCGAQTRVDDIVDTRPGYVYDTREQARNAVWGYEPRPGRAEVYLYPGCDDGRVVADIIRLDKGHTEGFEPRVTEAIIELMVKARAR